MIPLLDIQAQHGPIREELDQAIAQVLERGQFVNGPEIESFEEAFAAYCGAKEAAGVSNGTTALTVGLIASGVKPGDEVITTPFTFIATVEAILAAGAAPVLVDPNPDTALIEVDAVEAAITERTTALLPVHLYGQTVDLEAFRKLADRRGLILGEDAAQAHGAKWKDSTAGSVGDFATFSFFPGKNLGCLGDGGALTTNDPEIARRARSIRNHGQSVKYRHEEIGTNARLDSLQAAVLEVKLPHLPGWTERRQAHAAAYDEALAGIEGVEPTRVLADATSVYHQYVIRVGDRDAALALFKERGIGTATHYPIPLTRQPSLKGVADPEAFPNADRLAEQVMSLPVFPELTGDQQETVVATVAEHASV